MKIVSGCEYLKLQEEAKTIYDKMALEDLGVDFNMHDREIAKLKDIIKDKNKQIITMRDFLLSKGFEVIDMFENNTKLIEKNFNSPENEE